jgi:hypothetical protein
MTNGGTGTVPPMYVLVEQALYHQFIEMQTACTNNHISQIFFVFAAPMYWWDWLASPVQMVRYKGDCHVSSTSPNLQMMTNYRVGVSGTKKELEDGGQIKREKDIFHCSLRPISIICKLPNPPCFSLVTTFKVILKNNFDNFLYL